MGSGALISHRQFNKNSKARCQILPYEIFIKEVLGALQTIQSGIDYEAWSSKVDICITPSRYQGTLEKRKNVRPRIWKGML